MLGRRRRCEMVERSRDGCLGRAGRRYGFFFLLDQGKRPMHLASLRSKRQARVFGRVDTSDDDAWENPLLCRARAIEGERHGTSDTAAVEPEMRWNHGRTGQVEARGPPDVPMDDSTLPDPPSEAATRPGVSSGEHAAASCPPPSSTSGISDPPLTDVAPSDGRSASNTDTNPGNSAAAPVFQLSEQTTSVLDRIKANGDQVAGASATVAFEAAKEQMMRTMATADKFPTPTPSSASKRGGKAGRGDKTTKRASLTGDGIDAQEGATQSPAPRGRGRGRPRGSRGRGGARSGKRKREDRGDDDDDDGSDDSEVYTPAATQTKSGRAIQKPTVFVPPPVPSPTVTQKRKKTYRRNPESAVCKVCLRGTSPKNNMIVFCDGCNTPYHRYCHHPPIDQSVIDQLDKEWYCKPCEKERKLNASQVDLSTFVPAPGASLAERQNYFSSLPPKLLVRLLTRVTSLQPSLPVFSPEFKFQGAGAPETTVPSTNGHSQSQPESSLKPSNIPPTVSLDIDSALGAEESDDEGEDNDLGPAEHPANYPRPGYGLMRTLPPEQDDQQWLVDDEDRNEVFTHVYRADATVANMNDRSGKASVN
nr:swm histone demethylase complex subunit phf1 [Quercus suber]